MALRQDQHLAARQQVQRAVVPAHLVAALGGPAAGGGDELTQAAPAVQIAGQRHQARVAKVELRAVKQLERPQPLLARVVGLALGQQGLQVAPGGPGPHHPGHGALVGDGQGRITELVRPLHQLLGVGGAAQKAEVAQAMQLGIAGQSVGGQRGRHPHTRPRRRRRRLRHKSPAGTSGSAAAPLARPPATQAAPGKSRPGRPQRCGR